MIGTLINVVAILIGTALGTLIGSRIPDRTRTLVTDALGLVSFLAAAGAASAMWSTEFVDAVGEGWPILVVLGSLLIGGLIGSALRIEDRLNGLGKFLESKFSKNDDGNFVAGFVSASLIFCVGPMAILGSISDGLGEGNSLLILKSVMDGFAAIAFAAALGWGVGASALSVLVYQGAWSGVGFALGSVLSEYQIAAMTSVGGMLLIGIGMRLLNFKIIAIGDLLPALAVAPFLAVLVANLR
jgi:uncharacterized membrane protein YqgA involved in biofilm formation